MHELRRRRALLLISIALAAMPVACGADDAPPDDDAPRAVVLAYHHVSKSTPRSTSVTPAMFERHLDYLEREGYTVVPLADIVRSIENGKTLPDNAVALTFDDAYESVYTEALPRLEERGWAFTVFASTDYLDGDYGGYLTWEQLRDIEERGGAVGNHSASHVHLIRREARESESAWRRRVAEDIRRAQSRLEEELASPLRYFAYPYGEFDRTLEEVVGELGFIGFGQQSGPIGPTSDTLHLPRFPVAAAYADIDTLADKLQSRPLPVTVLAPQSRVLAAEARAPELRLRIPAGSYDRERLRCYVTGQDPAQTRWRGDEVLIRAHSPLAAGRSKYNCTAPSTTEPGVFYWYSYLWVRPRDDGSWYQE